MISTRFNPTTNGNLHLGHLYTLLVNERFAHERGGKFHVRFDNTDQAISIEMEHPEKANLIGEEQEKIIDWFGIEVDSWSYQSDLSERAHEELEAYSSYIFPDPYPHYQPLIIGAKPGSIPYPYTPYQTAERVIMDSWLGITHIIRGEDFVTEYSLYRYFCDVFGKKYPHFVFLPRLESLRGDISKTNGGYSLTELRGQGYKPEEIIDLLRKACLRFPWNGWGFENLRPNPKICI